MAFLLLRSIDALPSRSVPGRAVDAHFRRARFARRLRMELGSNETIRQALAGGLGLSVPSAHALGAAADVVTLAFEAALAETAAAPA